MPDRKWHWIVVDRKSGDPLVDKTGRLLVFTSRRLASARKGKTRQIRKIAIADHGTR
ncbi:MAG: hypothetical protein ACOCTI_05225 [Phycisphaeraceae bacterium]